MNKPCKIDDPYAYMDCQDAVENALAWLEKAHDDWRIATVPDDDAESVGHVFEVMIDYFQNMLGADENPYNTDNQDNA